MHRREVLIAGSALGASSLGGCAVRIGGQGTSPQYSVQLNLDPLADASDAGLARWHLDTVPSGEWSRVLATTVANGSATWTGTRDPRFSDGDRIVYEGTVYRVSHETVATESVSEYAIEIVPATGSIDDQQSIRYEDLPAADRAALAGHDDVGHRETDVEATYTSEERNRSVLVPEPEYAVVAWGPERRARVDTVELLGLPERRTLDYTVERLTSASAYGARLRQTYLVPLVPRSTTQRDILETAVTEKSGYTVDGGNTPPRAFEGLFTAFQNHQAVRSLDDDDDDPSGEYLVRYDGQVFAAWLDLTDSALAWLRGE